MAGYPGWLILVRPDRVQNPLSPPVVIFDQFWHRKGSERVVKILTCCRRMTWSKRYGSSSHFGKALLRSLSNVQYLIVDYHLNGVAVWRRHQWLSCPQAILMEAFRVTLLLAGLYSASARNLSSISDVHGRTVEGTESIELTTNGNPNLEFCKVYWTPSSAPYVAWNVLMRKTEFGFSILARDFPKLVHLHIRYHQMSIYIPKSSTLWVSWEPKRYVLQEQTRYVPYQQTRHLKLEDLGIADIAQRCNETGFLGDHFLTSRFWLQDHHLLTALLAISLEPIKDLREHLQNAVPKSNPESLII